MALRFGDGRDSFVGGDCDEAFLELSARLGWLEELRAVRDELPEESQRRLDARSS